MNKNSRREIFANHRPMLREEEGGTGRAIEGYAVVFGQESHVLWDHDIFREVIDAGAVTQADLDLWDIKMTMWHNRERLLARRNKGEGTLTLTVDDTGVKYSFIAPATPDGDTAVELVKRGDIAGASFTFWADRTAIVEEAEGEDGVPVRHIRKIAEISECTLASDPAYPQTSAEARERREHDAAKQKRDNEAVIRELRGKAGEAIL